jgi:hypothetical protein
VEKEGVAERVFCGLPPDQATLFGLEEMEALLALAAYLARLLLAISHRRSLFPWVPEVCFPLLVYVLVIYWHLCSCVHSGPAALSTRATRQAVFNE